MKPCGEPGVWEGARGVRASPAAPLAARLHVPAGAAALPTPPFWVFAEVSLRRHN